MGEALNGISLPKFPQQVLSEETAQMSPGTYPSAVLTRPSGRGDPTVRTKCGLVELAGIEPRSLVGASLKLLTDSC